MLAVEVSETDIMDVIKKHDIDITRSVYVCGVEDTYSDRDIIVYFEQFGPVARLVRVEREGDVNLGIVVEFISEMPVECPNDPSVAWHIDTVKVFCGASSQLPAVLPFQTPDPDESSDSDSNSEPYN